MTYVNCEWIYPSWGAGITSPGQRRGACQGRQKRGRGVFHLMDDVLTSKACMPAQQGKEAPWPTVVLLGRGYDVRLQIVSG